MVEFLTATFPTPETGDVVARLPIGPALTDYLWFDRTPDEREHLLRLNLETDAGAAKECAERVAVWKTLLAVHLLELALPDAEDQARDIIRSIISQHRKQRDDFRMSEKQLEFARRYLRDRRDDHGPTIEADE